MTKLNYNLKLDIPQDADSVRYFIPEGYTARIEDGVLIIEPKESEGEKIRKEIVSFIRDFWVDHRDSVPQTSKWLDWLEKQKDSPMPEDTVIFQKGVEEGRRLEREDMEKERLPIIETYQRSWYTEGYYDGKLKKEPRWIIKNQGICTKFEENPKYGQSLEEEQKPLPGFDDLTPDEKMNHPLYLEGFDAGREVGRVEAEQKPEWSEEDEKMVETICKEGDLKPSEQRWLKSLPERFNLQPQQEWSDEDELMRTAVIQTLETFGGRGTTGMQIDWMKSLRPQSHWKPSDEQMEALLSELPVVKGSGDKVQNMLESLYDDLKKLL